MAFNSDTYHMNKCRKLARQHMDTARSIRSNPASTALDMRMLPGLVRQARLCHHQYLGWRRIKAIG